GLTSSRALSCPTSVALRFRGTQRRASQIRLATNHGINPFASATSAAPSTVTVKPSESRDGASSRDAAWTSHTWKWRGYTIHYKTAGCGEPILLVHGFGLSSFHFRRNIPVLAEKYKVYAVDLLGFGRSSKPILQYSMEVWRDLLLDFCAQVVGAGRPPVLVGNSIGALACLMVNAASPPGAIRGTVLLNSAGAMNNKGVLGDVRILAALPLLLLIDFLLSIPAFSAALFNRVRTKDNIRQVLSGGVYCNPAAVDEALVEEVFGPSCDPGAREVFVSVITGPPGPKPWSLMPDVKGPLLVLWGDKDTLTPADGPVGRFLQALPSRRPETTFKMLQDVGHCLHDDRPDLVHSELLPWLEGVVAGRDSTPAASEAASAFPSKGQEEEERRAVQDAAVAAAAVSEVGAAAEAVAVAATAAVEARAAVAEGEEA
ncbi:hypothetical protein Agub_g7427, partial [Astrephomene gubernaculifera]